MKDKRQDKRRRDEREEKTDKVSMVSVAQCVVLTALYTFVPCCMSDIHVDITSSPVFFSSLVYTPAYTCSHIFTSVHDPPTSLRCWHGSGAVCAWWHATLLSAHVPALLTGAENPATSQDKRRKGTRATLTEDGTTAAKKLFPNRAMNERGPAIGSDQRKHRQERSIGMASVDHEIRAKHSAESTESHEHNHQCKDLSLRAHSLRDRTGRMAREHSQVGIEISGDLFNVSMKKALFLDVPMRR